MPKSIEGYVNVQAYVPRNVYAAFCRWTQSMGTKKSHAIAVAIKAAIPQKFTKGMK